MGQFERSTSSTTQHQRQPDVIQESIGRYDVERQSNTGYNGSVGDGSRADRVCGLRPSCATPMQPHRRHTSAPSSFQRDASYMGSRCSSGTTQLGHDDGSATYTASQSFGPTRAQPRLLDYAHGSPQYQPSSSLPHLPHRHHGRHGSGDARFADENSNVYNSPSYSEGGHAMHGYEGIHHDGVRGFGRGRHRNGCMPSPKGPSPQVVTLGGGHDMDLVHLKAKLTPEDNENLSNALKHQLELYTQTFDGERERERLQRQHPAAVAATHMASTTEHISLAQHEEVVKRAVEDAIKAERLKGAATREQARDDASAEAHVREAIRSNVKTEGEGDQGPLQPIDRISKAERDDVSMLERPPQ